jgi:CheY-like chemotaxis protein
MGNLARSKGLLLRVEGWQELDRLLLGDSVRLSQVLMNLIGNAIKFTEHGSVVVRVEVQTSPEHQQILNFSVTDTGIGIAPEQQAHVFEAFKQSDSSINRRYGGTGLGLSICKHLVQLMHGSIGMLSQPGQGSVFWFTLPCVLGAIEPSDPAEPSTAAPSSAQALKNRHVLVADDNEMNRTMLKRMLMQEGASVSLAENGLQAVQAVQQAPHAFDVVLMDVKMPVMDGLTAIALIRNQLAPSAPNALPILACSAGVHPQDCCDALAAGAAGFVSKPIMRTALLEKLKSIFSITSESRPNELPARIPVAAQAPVWPVIDGIDSLALQSELEGDLEFFITLLTGLRQALKEALVHLPKEIQQAHDQANARLHKLRGSLGCVGAHQLIASCLRLEDSIKADDAGSIAKHWHHLELELELLMENMEQGLLDSSLPEAASMQVFGALSSPTTTGSLIGSAVQ